MYSTQWLKWIHPAIDLSSSSPSSNTGIQPALPPSLTHTQPTTHSPSYSPIQKKPFIMFSKTITAIFLASRTSPPQLYLLSKILLTPIPSVVRIRSGRAAPCGRGRRRRKPRLQIWRGLAQLCVYARRRDGSLTVSESVEPLN